MMKSPVKWVMNSMGLGPRSSYNARQPNSIAGTRQRTKTKTLLHLELRIDFIEIRTPTASPNSAAPCSQTRTAELSRHGKCSAEDRSEILPQVHPVIEVRYLVAVAVEH